MCQIAFNRFELSFNNIYFVYSVIEFKKNERFCINNYHKLLILPYLLLKSPTLHDRVRRPRLAYVHTASEILPDRESAQRAVGDVEIGEHFQFHHLIGDVEECLRVHGDGCTTLLPTASERTTRVSKMSARMEITGARAF